MIKRFIGLSLPNSHQVRDGEGGGLRDCSQADAFIPARSPFPRTGLSLLGALPWFWAMGFLFGWLAPDVLEGRGFSNKLSVLMGPNKDFSQNRAG